jgi:hypothetical protein
MDDDDDLEAALAALPTSTARRRVVEVRRGEKRPKKKERGGSYQLELIACGKEKCKCNRGALHGPYWYEYRWSVRSRPKRLVSRYIGKPGSPAAVAAGLDKQLRLPGC